MPTTTPRQILVAVFRRLQHASGVSARPLYRERLVAVLHVHFHPVSRAVRIVLLAFFSTRANARGVWAGIIACLLFTAYATLTQGKEQLLDLAASIFKLPG